MAKNGSGDQTGLKGIFRSLQYRNYRLFFAGQGVSLIGTWMQRIAVPWLVYRMTGSALLLGVVGFAGQIPVFLLTPLAGVISDRCNRYRLLIVTQVLAMIQALLLSALYFTGVVAVWHLVLLGTVLGCINAFEMPVRQSLMVNLIDRKEDLGNAIALNSTVVNAAKLLGPSIAGILIAAVGEGFCFALNGASYLFVIMSLMMMNLVLEEPRSTDSHVLTGLKEGFLYTFGFIPIKSIILLLALVTLTGMPYTILMPAIVRDTLHGTSHTFGFLMAASGAGALTSALYFASRKSVVGLDRIICVAAAVFGAGLFALSLSSCFYLSLVLMPVIGGGMMLQMASSNTILQTIVDDDKRGRVMSFYTMAFVGTAPFGSLLAGWLAESMGTANTLMLCGAACMTASGLFARRLPELRKMVYPIYVKMGIIPGKASEIRSLANFE